MSFALLDYFNVYSPKEAPFMHKQLGAWEKSQPLKGLNIVHHVPVVENTLLKIACLTKAGAKVTVTHPYSFCQASEVAIATLSNAGIRFIEDPKTLKNECFDLYFDCGAELYQILGAPQIGAIELTGSGDEFYRQQELSFPVISIDRTLTKQLETVFGCAESSYTALSLLTGIDPASKSWLIFGFGKIGRGLAYYCKQNQLPIVVVDVCDKQRQLAQSLGIKAIHPEDNDLLKEAILNADIIATATGKKAIMNAYPTSWFSGKILANLGVYDEFGPLFREELVLNNKKALNFVLKDPTPMRYIDPEFWIHNQAALLLLSDKLSHEVHSIPEELDKQIIENWCAYHSFPLSMIKRWFIGREVFKEDSELVG
ncbi:NAD-binding protein [Legionella sp. km772]|uniref:NAD-binding protein n=1 Tax=Legionella sp. km772 TaxID=2498111 RepID=UPI000F8D6509|nr:NAD-binding protein [Legionella sp. km772]RUR07323.1 adenosylhomocysteinase [Legionella sp. km772]